MMLVDENAPRWNAELGLEHREALGYMNSTKSEMEIIMEYVEEVHSDHAADTLESCYSDTKRLVAMEEGFKVFDEIDANGDGKLTLDEVSTYFDRNPQTLERLDQIKCEKFTADWLNMLDMLDCDGDKKVTEDEFLDFWMGNNIGPEKEGLSIFRKIDKSGDGELSTHEVKRYLQEDRGLRERLADTKKAKLLKEWDAFFAMMADGTSGEFDKTQFASLWSASGLGLNIKRTPTPTAATPKPAPRPRPHTARPASAPPCFTPRPPATSRPSTPSPVTYLCVTSADLERPCVASRVDYHQLIQEQSANLRERDDQINSYKDMLRKVEQYQRISIKVLEAHYGALDASARWKQLKHANKTARMSKVLGQSPSTPSLPPIPKPPVGVRQAFV